MTAVKKRSWAAFFLSFLIPGLGHYRIGQTKKAWAFLLAGVGMSVVNVIVRLSPVKELIVYKVIIFLILGIIVSAAVDAFLSSAKCDLSLRRKWPKVLFFCLLYFGVMFGLAIGIRLFFAQAFRIPSEAMSPALKGGDRFMADKFIYRFHEPKRGDVVVFILPQDRKRTFVKRVVGLPGEQIGIKDGKIYVNGQPLTQPAVFDQIYYYNGGDFGARNKVVDVPEGHYFVLGDHSDSSHDSRYWGFVPSKDIIGRAYMIFEPLERKGPIR